MPATPGRSNSTSRCRRINSRFLGRPRPLRREWRPSGCGCLSAGLETAPSACSTPTVQIIRDLRGKSPSAERYLPAKRLARERREPWGSHVIP